MPDDVAAGSEPEPAATAAPTLLSALLRERHWRVFRTFEVQFSRAARELAEREQEPGIAKVTVSARTFERWYHGQVRSLPRSDASRVLEHMFGLPVQQLLGPADAASSEDPQCAVQASARGRPGTGLVANTHQHGTANRGFGRGDTLAGRTPVEWPVWFGMRLARLIGLVDNWREATADLDSLQTILHREVLMLDAAGPDDDEVRALHALSRRQALITLAALPLTLTASSSISVGALSPSAATDFFLSRCAASLTACWHLLRGSDLSAVYQMLSSYLLALEGTAQRQSGYQQAAARLASQAHRICGIVALHRDQLRVREHHCKQALYYATLACDKGSQASALISLASTYFYDDDPARAASVYEQAPALESGMSALQLSRVYAELSVVYGQLSREKDAVRATGLAEELYPDDPEQDPSFLYAEFTPASLSLETGLAYTALAEQHPGRGYERKAAGIFSRVDEMTSAVPDRIRFEVVNHQARTAVLMGDLDAFEGYMNRGIEGVVLLESGQRRREMRAALALALKLWPRETRMKALTDGVRLVIGADGAKGHG